MSTEPAPGSNQYIAGGVLDFGTREAIIVNESGNSAFIRSEITGSGGLTKAGAQTVYLDNSNSYTGDTNIAEGILVIRDQHALGGSDLVRIENDGRLYLELGTNVSIPRLAVLRPNLYIGINSVSTTVLHSNSANNTWGGDVIIDTVDNAGNWVFTPYIGTNSLYTLNIDGDIYGNEEGGPGIAANHISRDTALNDARLLSTAGVSSSGGVINLNGQFHDNQFGGMPHRSPPTTKTSSCVSSDSRQRPDGGQRTPAVGRGGSHLCRKRHPALRGRRQFLDTAGGGQPTMPPTGRAACASAANSNNWNAAVILTKPGQVLNIGRIDIGGDGTSDLQPVRQRHARRHEHLRHGDLW
jgi:autotransporter-associated beta strand protein